MRTSLPLLAFAIVFPLAACGAKVTVDSSGTSTGSGGAGGAAPAVIGHFQADCAPNDGPAKTFVFDDLGGCGPLSQPVPLIQITVSNAQLASVQNGGIVNVSGDINGGAQGFSVSVTGSTVGNSPITSGTLSFGVVVDGVSATGTFNLSFQNGTQAQGAFDVTWCTGGVMCG